MTHSTFRCFLRRVFDIESLVSTVKNVKIYFEILIFLKVHKIENFFGSEFEFYTISLLDMPKY
jgi:hypothetical protein